MYTSQVYEHYQSLIRKALEDTVSLPSLPAITLKIRNAVADPDISVEKLAGLIAQDPALAALLIKYSASPLYQTQHKPTTLQGVITLIGMQAVSSIVMTHSIKSLFVMHKPRLRELFHETWRRQITKASMSAFLARKLRYHPAEEVLLTALLTDVGTLALLSALNDAPEVPTRDEYISLCRDYSKSLGTILLTKWRVDERILNTMKQCGIWEEASPGIINMTDIINLALYHTIIETEPHYELPPIVSLRAYHKLPEEFRPLTTDGKCLQLIGDHCQLIQDLTVSLA